MKAGRKRKICAREPNGREVRAESDKGLSPAIIKRMIERAAVGAADPRLGSVVGRLLLQGDLSARQAGAAWQFAEIAERYHQAIVAPYLRGQSFECGVKAADPEESSDAGQAAIERDRRAVRRYERASAVLDGCGAGGALVRSLAFDVPLSGWSALVSVRVALDALASHFAS